MSYRISKQGEAYIPQYQCNDNTWRGFKKEDLKGTMLGDLADAIGTLDFPRRWETGAMFTKKEGSADDKCLFFRCEMHCMAFIGGAKSFWSTTNTEVTI